MLRSVSRKFGGDFPPRRAVHRLPNRASSDRGARDEAKTSDKTKDVSHKASSMSGFKEPGFADRQKAAQQAKQNLLNKFRAQPGPDDPDVAKRRAEREAVAARREKARLEREA